MMRMLTALLGLAVVASFLSSKASGSLLLASRGPGGIAHASLIPGQEIELTISLTALSPLVLYSGGDFTINSGSDSTFQHTTYLLSGAGGWTTNPPQGGTSRSFIGGPASTHVFLNIGEVLDLGRIVMRQGSNSGFHTTSFTDVLQLDEAFGTIPVQTSSFSYGIPEPSSWLLLALGSTLLLGRRKSRALNLDKSD